MHPATDYGSLVHGCAFCNYSPNRYIKCDSCEVVRYCSPEHQTLHKTKHRPACEAVMRCRHSMDTSEGRLRFIYQPLEPFEAFYGDFWVNEHTRVYMLVRMDLVKTLRRLRTPDSVAEQLKHVQHMLELSVRDEVMARIAAPALLLRMGQDRECYSMVKRWRAIGKACEYHWHGFNPVIAGATLDLATPADVFEPVEYFCDHNPKLNDSTVLEHSVAMTLLKIRLIIDLSNLQKVTVLAESTLGSKLPYEIIDHIRGYVPQCAFIRADRTILYRTDHSHTLEALNDQINSLYRVVKQMSDRFWPVMLDQYDSFEGRFRVHDRTGAAECPGGLRNSYDSWIETPGALEFLRMKLRDDPSSLKFYYLLS